MAIGINLGDDDEDVGPFSHWNEDFKNDLEDEFAKKLFVAGPPEDYIPIKNEWEELEENDDLSFLEAFEDKYYPVEEHTFLWWGYKHTNGSLQAKRYFGPLDTDEARDSPFCAQVVGPFPARDREEALEKVKQLTT